MAGNSHEISYLKKRKKLKLSSAAKCRGALWVKNPCWVTFQAFFYIIFHFFALSDFFQNHFFFQIILSDTVKIHSRGPTVLIWVQTVCNGRQKSPQSNEILNKCTQFLYRVNFCMIYSQCSAEQDFSAQDNFDCHQYQNWSK